MQLLHKLFPKFSQIYCRRWFSHDHSLTHSLSSLPSHSKYIEGASATPSSRLDLSLARTLSCCTLFLSLPPFLPLFCTPRSLALALVQFSLLRLYLPQILYMNLKPPNSDLRSLMRVFQFLFFSLLK